MKIKLKNSLRYILKVCLILLFSYSGGAQTWIATNFYDTYNGAVVHHDSTVIGPLEMCVTSNHMTYSIVRIDQDQTNQLFRFDSSGTISINSNISHSTTLAVESCFNLHPTKDNGCVYVFSHISTPNVEFKVVKVGYGGGPSWTKNYQSLGPDPIVVNDIVPTSFNTYYLIFSDSLVELNAAGGFIRNRFPFSGSISTMNDSDFILFDGNISRQDFNGTIKWSIPYSGYHSIYTDTSIIYAVKGNQLYKIHASDGSIAWSKNIPHLSNYPVNNSTISITSDQGIIASDGQNIISRYDSSGSLLWSRTIPFPLSGYRGIIENNPGCYITGGSFKCTFLYRLGLDFGFSYFLTSLDSTGHGVIDSTDQYFNGNANDNNTFSFGDDGAYVAAALNNSGIPRSPVLRDASNPGSFINLKSVFGTNWSGQFPAGINYKYSDVDGNGIIDTADIRKLAEAYPFQRSNVPSHWRLPSQSSQLPDLKVLIEEDSILAGDSITIDIIVGDTLIPVDSIYALSLTIMHSYMFYASDGIATVPISDFGDPSVNLYSYLSTYSSTGSYISFVISRKDHINAYVNGDTVARIRMKTANVHSGFRSLSVIYNAITVDGYSIPMNVLNDSINFISLTDVSPLSGDKIKMFPNPANNHLTINYNSDLFMDAEFSMFNLINQKVFSKSIISANDLVDIDVQRLPDGIYSCHLTNGKNETLLGKLSVIHR